MPSSVKRPRFVCATIGCCPSTRYGRLSVYEASRNVAYMANSDAPIRKPKPNSDVVKNYPITVNTTVEPANNADAVNAPE